MVEVVVGEGTDGFGGEGSYSALARRGKVDLGLGCFMADEREPGMALVQPSFTDVVEGRARRGVAAIDGASGNQ